MRVALLSCGPSLGRSWSAEMSASYDRVIGVNDAVCDFECHWWAVMDWHVFARVRDKQGGPIGNPSICGSQGFLSKLAGHSTMDFPHRWNYDSLRPLDGIPMTDWSFHTATAALILAWHLEAKVIDCFGVDMDGKANYRGDACPHRKPNRWRNEINLWSRVVAALNRQGVTVNRCGAEVESWA